MKRAASVTMMLASLAVSPAPAAACSCQTLTQNPSVWPPGNGRIPRNTRFLISRTRHASTTRAAQGFPPPGPPKCAPGDPFCLTDAREPTGAAPSGAVQIMPHPPVLWPEPPPRLQAFLWRYPAGARLPVLVEADAQPAVGGHDIALVPREPLAAGGHYEVALGPSREFAFPWAAYLVTDEISREPPPWGGPTDARFSPPDEKRLGTCVAGGTMTMTLGEVHQGPTHEQGPALLSLEALWEHGGRALVRMAAGKFLLGVHSPCAETPLVLPASGPFSLRMGLIDAAGNHGQGYLIEVDASGVATVTATVATPPRPLAPGPAPSAASPPPLPPATGSLKGTWTAAALGLGGLLVGVAGWRLRSALRSP